MNLVLELGAAISHLYFLSLDLTHTHPPPLALNLPQKKKEKNSFRYSCTLPSLLPMEYFSGGGSGGGGGWDDSGNRPSPRKELQGPRPSALKVNKDSYKIRKPPVAPPPPHNPPPSESEAPPPQPAEDRQPVIIYAVSPKVIHTTVSDFRNLVQRLTGNTTADGGASSSGAGNISPAARLASIEKASPPKEREFAAANGGVGSEINESNFFLGDFLEGTDVEMGSMPGILTPAPGSIPPISPGFFSPAGDPFMMGLNMFITSPSTLFTGPMASPSPSSSSDLFNFNPFFDF
ncbi:hypothetical protein ABFS83_08G095500 [Erythranthe nasuta]